MQNNHSISIHRVKIYGKKIYKEFMLTLTSKMQNQVQHNNRSQFPCHPELDSTSHRKLRRPGWLYRSWKNTLKGILTRGKGICYFI